uniref:Uncharacterized protein n=1 Tax=Rhizophora mucronata TaxID=61149 RepID=A0A2P2KCT9_RHIMU
MMVLNATTSGLQPISSITLSNRRASPFLPNLHKPFKMVV